MNAIVKACGDIHDFCRQHNVQPPDITITFASMSERAAFRRALMEETSPFLWPRWATGRMPPEGAPDLIVDDVKIHLKVKP